MGVEVGEHQRQHNLLEELHVLALSAEGIAAGQLMGGFQRSHPHIGLLQVGEQLFQQVEGEALLHWAALAALRFDALNGRRLVGVGGGEDAIAVELEEFEDFLLQK